MHRTHKIPVVAFALVALLCGARSAAAQPVATGLALDRFDPAERGSEWFALDSLDLRGRVRPAMGVDLDWGHEPLVLYDINNREDTRRLVHVRRRRWRRVAVRAGGTGPRPMGRARGATALDQRHSQTWEGVQAAPPTQSKLA